MDSSNLDFRRGCRSRSGARPPRIPESEGIHRTGTRPLRNCPTHRYQSKQDQRWGGQRSRACRKNWRGCSWKRRKRAPLKITLGFFVWLFRAVFKWVM
ncbi:hypothetical protein DWV61_03580 [Bifidobacterium pseudocatenulatum]|nr:hypothetical protein DXD87_03005 [Bifidobacterium pseudocatenulatum]RGW61282.1 hypothetical protein DWV61_03580 [Bifidobacterium pseudocatenulatum]RHF18343.1 hypothetical protein DW696_03035 [Bifidobacterium pseudocatenulatum]